MLYQVQLRRTLRGCVDWNNICYNIIIANLVAPFAGAWIEIVFRSSHFPSPPVAPFAGAWIEIIKHWVHSTVNIRRTLRGCVDWNHFLYVCNIHLLVAPFAGAWIEIQVICIDASNRCVAPFAGAWIEILSTAVPSPPKGSHPSRVRGLKFALRRIWTAKRKSHPSRVRGLK